MHYMSLTTKPVDQEVADAIQKYLEGNGRVRSARPDIKKIGRDTWQGAKITRGFNFKQLTDRG